MQRYKLRYRQTGMVDVQEGVLPEATDEKEAIEMGHWFCAVTPGRKFVRVLPEQLFTREEWEAVKGKTRKKEPKIIDNFADLPMKAASGAVHRGEISPEKALEIERANKNRPKLIQWLESKVDNPETQAAPF